MQKNTGWRASLSQWGYDHKSLNKKFIQIKKSAEQLNDVLNKKKK